ncbi:unnamed protein product, partial [Tenebrio molitor]
LRSNAFVHATASVHRQLQFAPKPEQFKFAGGHPKRYSNLTKILAKLHHQLIF